MFKEIEINKGIKLHYLKDTRFKTVTAAVFIRNMLSEENATKTALWAETLRGGCKKYPSMRLISKKLEEMWGSAYEVAVLKRGDEQLVYIYLEGLTKTFGEGMDFLKEVIFEPVINNERLLNKAKKRLKESIEASKDNKADYAVERMTKILAKEENNPFGVPAFGYGEKVDILTCEDMGFHYNRLIKTVPIDIYVVGSEKEEFVVKKCKEVFSYEREDIEDVKSEVYKSQEINCNDVVVETQDNNQGRLCMAFSSDEKDTKQLIKLLVLNEVLGGGSGSYLFKEVREKEGLCYSIGSFVFKQKMIIAVQAGIDESSLERVCEMAEKAMVHISESLEEKEFNEAKESLIKFYETSEDIPAELINFTLSMNLSGFSLDIDKFREEVKKIELKEVRDFAKAMKCQLKYFLK